MTRPETTLFLLISVDGKISTGDVEARDVDVDFPTIPGVAEGLHQYYELEKETDFFSLISGRVMAKIGTNEGRPDGENPFCTFIVIDNKPHLTETGVRTLMRRFKRLILVTDNPTHPAIACAPDEKLSIIFYEKGVDFTDLFAKLKKDYGAERLTIQSGGTLNAAFVRQGLVDHLSLVVAPVLIGGKDTASLIDGRSLRTQEDLLNLRSLKLVECRKLNDNYLHLTYDVSNEQ